LSSPSTRGPRQRELRNRDVFDPEGGLIGHVENVPVDDERRFRFVEVAVGGFMGLGKELRGLPTCLTLARS